MVCRQFPLPQHVADGRAKKGARKGRFSDNLLLLLYHKCSLVLTCSGERERASRFAPPPCLSVVCGCESCRFLSPGLVLTFLLVGGIVKYHTISCLSNRTRPHAEERRKRIYLVWP